MKSYPAARMGSNGSGWARGVWPLALLALLQVQVAWANPRDTVTSSLTASNTTEWTGCLLSLELQPSETRLEFSGSVQYSGIDLEVAPAGEETPSLSGSWQLGLSFGGEETQLTDEDCLRLLADGTNSSPTSIRLLAASQMQLTPNPAEMDLQISFGTLTQSLAQVFAKDVTVTLDGSDGQPFLPLADRPGSYEGSLDTTITGGAVQALSVQFNVNETAALGGPPASAVTTVELITHITQKDVTVDVRIANYSSSFFVQVDNSTSGTVVIDGVVAAHASIPLSSAQPPAEDPVECRSYSCQDPSESTAFAALAFECFAAGKAPAGLQDMASASGGRCSIEAELSQMGASAPMSCLAVNCSLSPGLTSGDCAGLQCTCPGECLGLGSVVATLSSTSFACPPGSDGKATCEFSFGGAATPLAANLGCNSNLCPSPATPPTVPLSPPSPPASIDSGSFTPLRSTPPESAGGVRSNTPGPAGQQEPGAAMSCPAGLTGIGCTFCDADAACGADSTCDDSFVFGSTAAVKSYACVPDSPDVANIVTSVDVMCNTTGSAELEGLGDVDPKKSFCRILTEVSLAGQEVSVGCTAYNCGVALNSSSISCSSTSCNCGQENPDCSGLSAIVQGIQAASIDCSDTGSCSVVLEGLPLGEIGLSCETGTCTGSGEFNGTESTGQAAPDWLRLQVAAVGFLPTICLLLGLTVTLLATRGCAGILLACGGRNVRFRSSTVVSHLAFSELTVTVPQRRQRAAPVTGSAPGKSQGTSASTSSAGSPVAAAENGEASKLRAPQAPDGTAGGSSKGSKKRLILSSVSCSASKGEVLAIMGPSGSGKTTLLSILAAREGDLGRGAKVAGSVLVDGSPRRQKSFRSACGYVPQDDTLFASLTVRETVAYSARFRMPELSPPALNDRVDCILEELRLSHVAPTRIGSSVAGSSGRGVSGGERRRVSIAMEMVTEPSIIMLDEPTSGLDSFAAGSLMSSLKDIAVGGRVVVLTLHQPSPVAFLQLDKVLLLAAGQRVFHGTPAQAEPFLASAGFPCPTGIPVADHMLQVVSSPSSREAVLRVGESTDPTQVISFRSDEDGEASHATSESAGSSVRPGCLTSVHKSLVGTDILLWRNAMNLFRSPALLLMHNLIGLLMGCAMGVVFYGVDDSLAGLQNKAGGIFFTLAFFAFCSLTTVDSFLAERSIVMREVQSGYYSSANYMAVKIILDSLLLRVLPAVLFGIPFYFLMGLTSDWERVLVFFAVLTTFSATAGALAMAASVGCPTAGMANLIMTLVLLTSLVFGGFLANLEVMPPAVSWISYLSIFRYAFEALVVNEITGTFFDLDVSGFSVADLDSQLMLDVLGLEAANFLQDAAVLSLLFLLFSLAAGVILLAVMPRHRRRRSVSPGLGKVSASCRGRSKKSRVGLVSQVNGGQ